ncbi:MAG: hypothetical protein A2Z49_06955 [Chloroflexi bacterium RBG_19FT_COMBO_56_12]|nr:MAG: hypothetical protein A2Z49_06955 [Chloroflexi bacterium RBG_19FT_COMBO_56_12]
MKAVNVFEKDQVEQLESSLQAALKPVSLRREFAAQLRRRLDEEFRPVVTYPKKHTFQLILLATASVLSSLFLAVNGLRMVLSFLAAFGFWREMRKHSNHKRLASLRPAI